MANSISADQVVKTAAGLEKTQFSRDDLAAELSVKKSDIKDAIRQARQDGRLEKVGEDDSGAGVFSLTS